MQIPGELGSLTYRATCLALHGQRPHQRRCQQQHPTATVTYQESHCDGDSGGHDGGDDEEVDEEVGEEEQQGTTENRLVPDVAELRLLRRMERDLLESVEEVLLLHPELLEGGVFDPLLLEDITRLGHRHERTSNLFSEFRERLGLPDPDAEAEDAPPLIETEDGGEDG